MPEIAVHKVLEKDDSPLPVFDEIEKLIQAIQNRAFDVFSARGFGDGHALEDWLQAERELCWPPAQIADREKDFAIRVGLPGYTSSEIEVTVTPREIIVHAKPAKATAEERSKDVERFLWSQFDNGEVYRRIELPEDVDVNQTRASLKNGILEVTAAKTQPAGKQVPVTTAA